VPDSARTRAGGGRGSLTHRPASSPRPPRGCTGAYALELTKVHDRSAVRSGVRSRTAPSSSACRAARALVCRVGEAEDRVGGGTSADVAEPTGASASTPGMPSRRSDSDSTNGGEPRWVTARLGRFDRPRPTDRAEERSLADSSPDQPHDHGEPDQGVDEHQAVSSGVGREEHRSPRADVSTAIPAHVQVGRRCSTLHARRRIGQGASESDAHAISPPGRRGPLAQARLPP
jgi:hypothetical protein